MFILEFYANLHNLFGQTTIVAKSQLSLETSINN